MTAIRRYLVDWSGFQGGPGVSTFYSVDLDGMAADLHTFFTAIAGQIADAVNIQVQNTGLVIESTDGLAIGNFADVAQAVIPATGLGGVAGPAGAHVNWRATSFVAGKRVKGRTFLVPLATSAYEANGTLSATPRQTIQNAATALITNAAGNFIVWARPFPGRSTPLPAKPSRLGSIHTVSTADVPDKVAVLTSRRD